MGALLHAVALQVRIRLGSYVVGLLAKRLTSRRLLAWLMPTAAILQVLPALFLFAPHMWAVVPSTAMLALSLLTIPPLQALTSQIAPEGRVSEALGVVGSFKCLASLLGNLLVTSAVPLLQRTSLDTPLWVLHPACGLVALCAVPVLHFCVPAEPSATPSGHWVAGKASGPSDDVQCPTNCAV